MIENVPRTGIEKKIFSKQEPKNFPLLTTTFLCGQERKTFFCQHFRPKCDNEENTITFFSIHIRIYINKLQTNNLLYNTTKTIPGGAKYHDYPLSFKVLLLSKN